MVYSDPSFLMPRRPPYSQLHYLAIMEKVRLHHYSASGREKTRESNVNKTTPPGLPCY